MVFKLPKKIIKIEELKCYDDLKNLSRVFEPDKLLSNLGHVYKKVEEFKYNDKEWKNN